MVIGTSRKPRLSIVFAHRLIAVIVLIMVFLERRYAAMKREFLKRRSERVAPKEPTTSKS